MATATIHRRVVIGSLTAVIACGLWLLRSSMTPSSPCNVLLITLDTTRADRLGCYGYDLAHTPTLDDFAEAGTTFERAFTVCPLTQPAHTSLLTGLLPPEHGIRDNGKNSLSPNIPTMTTILSDHGYDTAAFIASIVLDSQCGLDRGFNIYDDDIAGAGPGPEPWQGDGCDGNAAVPASRSAASVIDAALRWLTARKSSSAPFFCWVHLYDPHFPYEWHPEIPLGTNIDAYDSEIAFMDRHIGRLRRFVEDRGLDDETLVIVVGDHGEGLHEHGEPTHGPMVYNSTIQIPLILSSPGRIPGGHRVTDPVSIVDVMPTVLDLLEIRGNGLLQSATAAAAGRGRTLLPAIHGQGLSPRASYAESMVPLNGFGWAPMWTIITDQWKFIRTREPELYNVDVDPAETENVRADNPAVAADLDAVLGRLAAAWVPPELHPVHQTEQQRRQLASLGYVGGTEAAVDISAGVLSTQELQDLRDMKRMMDVYLAIQEIRSRGINGDPSDEVLAACRQAIVNSPETTVLHLYLGNILTYRREFEGAAAAYRKFLQAQPEHADGHNNLAQALSYLEQFDEAAVHATEAIRINPDSAISHHNFGVILLAQGKVEEAIGHHRLAIDLQPSSHVIQRDLAIALAKAGRIDEAIRHYEQAIVLHDGGHEAARRLAWIFATHPIDNVRQPDRARQLAWTACEATRHEDPLCLDALAAAYATSGRYEKARDNAATAVRLAEEVGDDDLAKAIQARLELYEGEQPFRDDTFRSASSQPVGSTR